MSAASEIKSVNLTDNERSIAVRILRLVSCHIQYIQETGLFESISGPVLSLTVAEKASLTRLIAKF